MPIKFSELETKPYKEATKLVGLYTDNNKKYNCIIDTESINTTIDTNIKDILNLVYPVGSIYLSVSDINPLENLGIGTWVKVGSDRVLQGSGTRGVAGSTLEPGLPSIEHAHTISLFTSESGNHSHTRGSMNITGKASVAQGAGYTYNAEGAFYDSKDGSGGNWDTAAGCRLAFDASRTWVGSTSVEGNHSHRVFGQTGVAFSQDGNSTLYGKSDTVQPKAYIVNIWKRTN